MIFIHNYDTDCQYDNTDNLLKSGETRMRETGDWETGDGSMSPADSENRPVICYNIKKLET